LLAAKELHYSLKDLFIYPNAWKNTEKNGFGAIEDGFVFFVRSLR
jgi:hypothetical protein